jgi:hypothetical protein
MNAKRLAGASAIGPGLAISALTAGMGTAAAEPPPCNPQSCAGPGRSPSVQLHGQLGDADRQPRLQQLGILILRDLDPEANPLWWRGARSTTVCSRSARAVQGTLERVRCPTMDGEDRFFAGVSLCLGIGRLPAVILVRAPHPFYVEMRLPPWITLGAKRVAEPAPVNA